MPRGTILKDLVLQLKAEVGMSLVPGTSIQADAYFKQLLSNRAQFLACELDFPYLEDRWDVAVGVGSRYLNIPTTDFLGEACTINFQRPFRVETYFATAWHPLIYGIGAAEFNHRNSDLVPPQQEDMVQRWQLFDSYVPKDDTAGTPAVFTPKFEVWPVPSVAQQLRFTGQYEPGILRDDNDPCELDDALLVLTVATEYLAKMESADAKFKLALATERLARIRGALPQREEPLILGQQSINRMSRRARRLVPMVIVK